MSGKNIVVLSGGTGGSRLAYLFSLLSKTWLGAFDHITFIVHSWDDGGNTRILRKKHGLLAMGDARKIILTIMEAQIPERISRRVWNMLSFRFPGQSRPAVGNFCLAAAMLNHGKRLLPAIEDFSSLCHLPEQFCVLPVSESSADIVATFDDGKEVRGQARIARLAAKESRHIASIRIDPEPQPLPGALEAISQASIIVLGQGSFWTSLSPVLMTPGVREAIIGNERAKVIQVLNLFAGKRGEIPDVSTGKIVRVTSELLGKPVDVALCNDSAKLLRCNEELRKMQDSLRNVDPEAKPLMVSHVSGPATQMVIRDYAKFGPKGAVHSMKVVCDILKYME